MHTCSSCSLPARRGHGPKSAHPEHPHERSVHHRQQRCQRRRRRPQPAPRCRGKRTGRGLCRGIKRCERCVDAAGNDLGRAQRGCQRPHITGLGRMHTCNFWAACCIDRAVYYLCACMSLCLRGQAGNKHPTTRTDKRSWCNPGVWNLIHTLHMNYVMLTAHRLLQSALHGVTLHEGCWASLAQQAACCSSENNTSLCSFFCKKEKRERGEERPRLYRTCRREARWVPVRSRALAGSSWATTTSSGQIHSRTGSKCAAPGFVLVAGLLALRGCGLTHLLRPARC